MQVVVLLTCVDEYDSVGRRGGICDDKRAAPLPHMQPGVCLTEGCVALKANNSSYDSVRARILRTIMFVSTTGLCCEYNVNLPLINTEPKSSPCDISSTLQYLNETKTVRQTRNSPSPSRYCAATGCKPPLKNGAEATKAVKYHTIPVIVSNSERSKSQKSSGRALWYETRGM